jgi:hypothetical protein
VSKEEREEVNRLFVSFLEHARFLNASLTMLHTLLGLEYVYSR